MTKQGSKLRNLANVTFSNVIVFIGNIIVHLVLPLTLAVEEYSYWQLHTLYVGYCAFALCGLNDGIHLLYSNLNYEKENYPLFRSFRNASIILSMVGACTLAIVSLVVSSGLEQLILLIVAIETPAACLNSVFSYINQGTMRFKQYARGNRIEGISLLIVIIALFLLRVKNIEFYILGAALSKYIRLGYFIFSSREIAFGSADHSIESPRHIINTCRQGIILMISVTLNSSFLLFTKLMIKEYMGITEYGAFSFGLNMLLAANVLVLAVSQVFYPILSRSSNDRYCDLINSLDFFVSIVGAIAMAGYFIAALLIKAIYPQYERILQYLYILFPIFVFTCKINLVTMNTFKVKKMKAVMLIANATAVVVNIVLSWIAVTIASSLFYASIASLVTYIAFYYGSQVWIKRYVDNGININMFDLVYILMFELVIVFLRYVSLGNYMTLLFGLSIYGIVAISLILMKRDKVMSLKKILFK